MPAPPRAAVVGSGPSGFYAADHLLDAGFSVDMYEELPTPYGLVRHGVAPDHPKIKSVTRVFDNIATSGSRFQFFGGITIGEHVTRAELLDRYHAVVYATGSQEARLLSIPGEARPGSTSAVDLVGWYNGHPAHADHRFDFDTTRAVVIGNGNVALDVARMLVLPDHQLRATDTARHALTALAASTVREVIVVGRRGSAQAAFTPVELRELSQLGGVDVVVELDQQTLDQHDTAGSSSRVPRNLAILTELANRAVDERKPFIRFRFLRTPLEILGQGSDGPVTGIRLAHNRLELDPRGGMSAVATPLTETVSCGLVVQAIGYNGRALPGLPFDDTRGVVPNNNGRIVDANGAPLRGEYVVGWIKRGPSGVIGTNKKDSAETVACLTEDAAQEQLNHPRPEHTAKSIATWLGETVPDLVTWTGWEAIDAHEKCLGEAHGQPRTKLVRIPQLTAVAHGRPQTQGASDHVGRSDSP